MLIQRASKELGMDILKKAWFQTVIHMKRHSVPIGRSKLCRLFGKSRQVFYDLSNRQTDSLRLVDTIKIIRADLPRIGELKLLFLIRSQLATPQYHYLQR